MYVSNTDPLFKVAHDVHLHINCGFAVTKKELINEKIKKEREEKSVIVIM